MLNYLGKHSVRTLLLLVVFSIGLIFYKTTTGDYAHFTDEATVPSPKDFIAEIILFFTD